MYKQIRDFSIFIFSGLLCSTAVQAETEVETMQDMTVTATRVDRSLYDVPAAVSVVDSQDIANGKQRLGLDESLARVPGMFLQNRYNFNQSLNISIRGFGSRANFGTRGVKLYQDGIPLTTVDGQGGIEDIDLFAINRVEVIRGPASSLYGSSSGGVLNFKTGDDGLEDYVEASHSMGEYQTHISNIQAGGQLGKLDYFASLSHLDITGYRDNARSRNTKLNTKFIYDIDARSDFTVVMTAYDSPQADDPGGLTRAQVNMDRRAAQGRNLTFRAGEEIEQQKLGFTYRRDITPNQELVVRNYYVHRDFLARLPFGNFPGANSWIEFDRFQFGGGAQYNISGSLFGLPNRTTVGFDIDTQEDDRKRYNNANGVRGAQSVDQLEQGDAIGLYLRNELELTEKWELSFGLRYDNIELALDDQFLANGDQSSELTFDEFSPMGGILWKFSPEANFYANISSVFETPTFTELSDFQGGRFVNVDAQKALNYELGVKGVVGPRFNYELSLFHIDVEDEIVNVDANANQAIFENADTSRNGLEAMVTFVPVTGVDVVLSYTYNDFTFDSFPATQCSVTSCVDNKLPALPDHNLYTEVNYTHPSGFFTSMDFQFVSSAYVDNDNTEERRPYGIANLRAGYIKNFADMEITPYIGINNIFDEEFTDKVRINEGNMRYFEPAPELNIYAGLTVRFMH